MRLFQAGLMTASSVVVDTKANSVKAPFKAARARAQAVPNDKLSQVGHATSSAITLVVLPFISPEDILLLPSLAISRLGITTK